MGIPNVLDFIILAFVVACYFLSSLRGGVKQIFSFLVILVSFAAAGMFYGSVAAVFPEKVFPESFGGAVGFSTVFLAAFGVLSLIGRLMDDLFKRLHFGGIDRTISIVIGLLKGVALGCMFVIIIMVNYPVEESIVADSVATPYLLPSTRIIVKILPREEQKVYTESEKELKKLWRGFDKEG